MTGSIVDRTARAQVREVEQSPWGGRPAKTIFFGGGTPTFYAADQLIEILDAVRGAHPLAEDCEITTEANPGTVDAEKFAALAGAGFNRISLGAQSFFVEDLIRLGRVHQANEVGRAVLAARRAGIANINLDLMFGLPGQSLKAWQQNLDFALSLQPDHLSLYCLTIEPNTRFYKLHLKGMLDLPDDELQVDMYNYAAETMTGAGFDHYEISNFCKPGMECQHNLAYWRSEEYAGYGPGAVGTVGGVRTTVLKHPERYTQALEDGAHNEALWFEKEQLSEDNLYLERVMMGLRLSEGIAGDAVATPEDKLTELSSRGWIVRTPERIKLTPLGRHFCSEVALELIAEPRVSVSIR